MSALGCIVFLFPIGWKVIQPGSNEMTAGKNNQKQEHSGNQYQKIQNVEVSTDRD